MENGEGSMNKKCLRLAGIKHQLIQKRENGVKEVIWKIDVEQREYVEQLGYNVIPWIYEVTTRSICNIKNVRYSLIKRVHYANKRGQRKVYMKPKIHDLETLAEFGIKYRPFKYKIILR